MLVMIALLIQTAVPASWTKVGTADGHETYVDLTTVKRMADSKRTAWVRRQYKVAEEDGTHYRIAKLSYDCENETSALVAVTKFGAGNKVLDTMDIPPANQNVTSQLPGSIGYMTLKKVCLVP